MKFALNAPNFGIFADPGLIVELTREAEAAGWDGFFLWDHIVPGPAPLSDPWLLLAAIALNSDRLKFGPMVTPLPRRRPEEVARQATTLDHMSNGRFILGVGLGDDHHREFSAFGPAPADRIRGEMLDEGLEVLLKLWSGEVTSHTGKHYLLEGVAFQPAPVQRPRIPIWVAGKWPAPRPFRRAARWDGVVPVSQTGSMTPQICREIVEFMRKSRPDNGSPFDVAVVGGGSPLAKARQRAAEFAAAGATWYQVGLSGAKDAASALRLARQGPPG